MPDYIDRGIMKWQPFDALAGYQEMIKEMVHLKNKRQKPVLLEDKLEEMNRVIEEAISNKAVVRVTYYEDGYLYYESGYISKIDLYTQTMVLKPRVNLALDDIIQVEILDGF
jgi:hypothetical protein